MREGGTTTPEDQRKEPSTSDGNVEQNSHMKTFWYVLILYSLVYNYNTLIFSCSNDESVVTLDIPGAFLQTDQPNDDEVIIHFTGKMIEWLAKIDPKIYRDKITINKDG